MRKEKEKDVSIAGNLSLQKESFLLDGRLLDSFLSLFSVVQSILTHPFSLLKRRDSIFRSDLVSSLSVEDISLTRKDSSLWKRKNGLPSPEYVHAVDYDVKYNVTENFFLLYLLNDIKKELFELSLFYASLLPTAFSNGEDEFKEVSPTRDRIRKRNKRLNKILETSFFRGLKKARPKGFAPYKTNVLRNHPEYLYCFRFYQKRRAEKKNKARERKAFETYLGLRPSVLSYRKFEFAGKEGKKRKFVYSPYYSLTCLPDRKNDSFVFEFDNLIDPRIKSKHLLYIRKDTLFSSLNSPENMEQWKKYDTIEARSLFHQVSYCPSLVHKPTKRLDENWLLQDYFNDILRVRSGERKIYSKFCPCCKSNHVKEVEKDIFVCKECTSKYAFFDVDGTEHIQFVRLRRKDS